MEQKSLLDAIREAREAEMKAETTEENVEEIEKEKVEISAERVAKKYRKLQKDLLSVVKGQDQAIETICKTLFNKELFFNHWEKQYTETYASFFLFGAPGTGKTYTAETLAKLLNYPCKKFDMTAYANEGEQIGLVGSDRQWRNAARGELTTFIYENETQPHIVIFDEIEKAHKTTLDVFLSMLGSGKIYDPYLRKELDATYTIAFFTSNSGKDLYKDNSDISNVTITTLLDALEKDVDMNGKRRLSAEFCSRIVSGTPVIYNNLKLSDLVKIVDSIQKEVATDLQSRAKIKINFDKKLPLTFLYMSGSKDARVISRRYGAYIKDKLYDIPFDENEIKEINFEIDYKSMPDEIRELFIKNGKHNIVYVGSNENVINSLSKSKYNINVVTSSDGLKEALRKNIELVLVDPLLGGVKDKLISITDYNSNGINLFYELTELDNGLPIYILTSDKSMINDTDKQSLINDGARELICTDELDKLNSKVCSLCEDAYIENNIKKLTSKGYILDCKNKIVIEKSKKKVSVVLNKFRKYMDYDSDACKLMVKEDETPDVKFSDIIGAQNAKDELNYFIDYLKDPLSDKNRKLRVPKGILLYGPAGTGKTMLAKAMANEAGVNYISLNGSDLLGESPFNGVKKIEDVFSSAKRYAPTIIFIDEIDAIAKKRVGYADEAILNSLLTSMDGFKTSKRKPVFVLAATNFPIVESNNSVSIDPAILRRFDARICVDLPNQKERVQFVEHYLKKRDIKLDKDTIKAFSECSVGSSLAEIENIIELAIRNSIRRNLKLTSDLLLETYDEFFGGEIREQKQKDVNSTAIHEAGHAVVSYLSGKAPTYITIESRAYYGGYVSYGEEDNAYLTRNDLINRIRISLAGRASEEVFFKESGINSGASNDLAKATDIAKKIVAGFGMNKKLAVYGDEISAEQKIEIENILQEEYKNTIELVKKNKNKIKAVADELIKNNHLTLKEFKNLIK